MASPISASATRSPARSAISRSSCRRTRCFIRSPTCQRHLRRQPPLAVPARQRHLPLHASRCNPTLSSSQSRTRSPCSLLLPRLPPLKHSHRHQCSLRHWLPLPKASQRQPHPPHQRLALLSLPMALLSQPLALLSQPLVLLSLRFPLPQLRPKRPRLPQHLLSPRPSQRHLLHRKLCNPLPERFNPSVHRYRHPGRHQRLRRVHLWQGR